MADILHGFMTFEKTGLSVDDFVKTCFSNILVTLLVRVMLLSFLTRVSQVFFTLKLVSTFLFYPVLSTADLFE